MHTLLRLTTGLPRPPPPPRLSIGGGDATRLRCTVLGGGGDRRAANERREWLVKTHIKIIQISKIQTYKITTDAKTNVQIVSC